MSILNILDIFGTAVFALSGALAAARKGMDISGILLVGVIVGMGGGTLRDVLLNKTVFWFQHPDLVYLCLACGFLIFIVSRYYYFSERLLLVPDAIGLGVFSVVGAQIPLQMHLSWQVAVVMGVLTAAGGGVIRDVLCNEMPLILKREIYATAALAGSLCYVLLKHITPIHYAAAISIALVIIVRLAAIKFGLGLPVVRAEQIISKK